MESTSECPVCSKTFPSIEIEQHVNRCIFLNTKPENSFTENHNKPSGSNKRNFNIFGKSPGSNKKMKLGSTSSELIEIKSDSEEEKKVCFCDFFPIGFQFFCNFRFQRQKMFQRIHHQQFLYQKECDLKQLRIMLDKLI